MSMIGSLVTVRQLPGTTWVVRHVDGDGRLHLRSRDDGAADVSVITPAPTFTSGTEIEHDGKVLIVGEDKGGEVICVTQDVRWIWRDNTSLRVPGGNSYAVNKAD